jgi:CheY-like chemotaxis protein
MDTNIASTSALTDSANTVDRSGIKVVLAEDDTYINDLVSKKLTQLGYTVHSLMNGGSVVDVVKTDNPDVVLLDMLLPGLLGEQIIPLLKSDPQTEHIPIIVFSNLSDKDHIQKILKLGAAEYLIKIKTDLAHFDQAIRRNLKH